MEKFIPNKAYLSGNVGVQVSLIDRFTKRICLTIYSGENCESTTLDKYGVAQLISALQEAHSNMTE